MIDKEYTKEQIKRAKDLFDVLYPNNKSEDTIYTAWGKKSNTGVINTILVVMYGRKEELL